MGKLLMESIIETKAATLLEFLHGLRGELHETLEEGTWAAWLYDVLKPHVEEIVVRKSGTLELTTDDLCEIESAASKIAVRTHDTTRDTQ